jgi:uncharacterized protein
MNGAIKPAAAPMARPLRCPALPIASLATTSFKDEHLTAIIAEGKQNVFFEV